MILQEPDSLNDGLQSMPVWRFIFESIAHHIVCYKYVNRISCVSETFWHSVIGPMGILFHFLGEHVHCIRIVKAKIEYFLNFFSVPSLFYHFVWMSRHRVDTYIGWQTQFISFALIYRLSLVKVEINSSQMSIWCDSFVESYLPNKLCYHIREKYLIRMEK